MYTVHVDISNSCYWYWIISIPATWTRKKTPGAHAVQVHSGKLSTDHTIRVPELLRLQSLGGSGCAGNPRGDQITTTKETSGLEVWITTSMSSFFASWYMACWWDFLDFATWSRDPPTICKWGTDCMLATGVFCGHNHFKQNTQFTALSHAHLADTPPDSPSGVKVVRP